MYGAQAVGGLGTLGDVDNDGHEGEAEEEACAGEDQDSVSEYEGDVNRESFTSTFRQARGL